MDLEMDTYRNNMIKVSCFSDHVVYLEGTSLQEPHWNEWCLCNLLQCSRLDDTVLQGIWKVVLSKTYELNHQFRLIDCNSSCR